MPEGVSAMRGLALPAHPFSDTPFVVTAPRPATSTKSPYSRPAANVPDATVTGFFISNPPKSTHMFTEVGTGRRGDPSTKRVPHEPDSPAGCPCEQDCRATGGIPSPAAPAGSIASIFIYHTTFRASNTGPSTQARCLPSTVSTTHDRHAPTPQAMRFSMDTSQGTPASAAMPATIFIRGSGPHTAR